MEPGQLVGGKYRLTRKVGKGGMGTVWAATEIARGTPVAIKLLTTEAAGKEELRQRLVREANVATLVRHPNIVHFHEVGLTEDGEPFLVMELLHGQTLRQLMRDRGALDPPTALWIGCEIAKALHAAHEAAIAHRDLKPGNVFLSRDADGRVTVKVVDFGVSKFLGEEQSTLTSTGATIGSPAYMSPEQARGERIDHRTDIWALGVVLFEMLAGQRPFAAESPVALLSKILFGAVPRLKSVVPDVDPVVDAIVSRCLEHRMDARYQSIDQVLAALSSRQAAMAEAAQAKQAELAAWVEQPRAPEPADAPGREDDAPSTSGADSQSASESASSPATGSQSHSTTHGVAASVPSPPLPVRPRAAPRTSPKIPVALVAVPGLAVAALLVAVVILVVRAVSRGPSEEPDVIPAGTGAVVEPAPPAPEIAPPPETAAPPVPIVELPVKDAGASATKAPPKPTATPVAPPPVTKPVATAPVTKPVATAPVTKPVAAPTASPTTTPPPKPATTGKPCKRPIVDAAGKPIGCLD